MRRRSLSLEQKLPLLITGVLVVVVSISLVLTYHTLAEAARDAARTRLTRVAGQLASSIAANITARTSLQRRVASDTAIRRALLQAQRTPPSVPVGRGGVSGLASAREALALLTVASDSGLPIALWTDDGDRLLRLGRETQPVGSGELKDVPPSATGRGGVGPDSSIVSDFSEVGRGIFFGIWTPVFDGTRRLGYIAEQHRVTATPQGQRGLGALIGNDVHAYYRNRAGTLWTTLGGESVAPLERTDRLTADTIFSGFRRNLGEVIAAEVPISGTPWAIVLEIPERAVIAPTRATLARLSLFSLALVVSSAALALSIGRRVTRPITTLSAAAEAFAKGDPSREVDDTTGDEVGQLPRVFNTMRAEISATHAELEAQIEEAQSVAEELEQANEQLREATTSAELANRAKSDFLAVMSHELRTPLNAIAGYVQLIELGVHGPVTDAQRNALGRVTQSQQRLLTLVNDVLNFAKLDAGHVEYQLSDVPLDAALASLEALIAPQVRAKGITYSYVPCDPSLTVHADRDRLYQVIVNLLSNAVKFTPHGGSVTVESEATDDWVLVHVRDTGRGIPADRLATIFEPFIQVDRALNRPHEGVGLGLSISRELARGMGGDLTVTSEVATGSVFTMHICRTRPVSLRVARVAWASVTPDHVRAVRPATPGSA